MKGTGFKITKYRGLHTCKPVEVRSDFLAGELPSSNKGSAFTLTLGVDQVGEKRVWLHSLW